MAIVLDLQYKVNGITFGLESTNGKGRTDQFVARIKDTLSRLFDEFVGVRGLETPSVLKEFKQLIGLGLILVGGYTTIYNAT